MQTTRRERWLLLRWSLLGSLIVIEGALISARFDAAPLDDAIPGWWAGLLARFGVIVPLGLALGTAILLFAATHLRDELLTALTTAHRLRWRLLAYHLAAFAVFFYLTAVVFEGSLDTSPVPLLWAAAWLLAGAATVCLWSATILPPAIVPTIARRLGPVLPAGVVVGIAAWGAGDFTASWWDPLQYSTLWAVHRLLAPVVPALVFEPADHIVGTEHFLIEITQKCAGYEGMGLMFVFLGAYLWLFRRTLRFPNALLLLPIGLCLAWWANVVRIATLVAIGTWVSEAVAIGGFHAYSGSILFCTLALGLAFVAQRVSFFTTEHRLQPVSIRDDPTAAYLSPLLALVAAGMVTGMFTTEGVDPHYPLRLLVVVVTLWWFRSAYRDLRPTWSWDAAGFGIAAFILWISLAAQPDAAPASWPVHLARPGAIVWGACRLVGAVVAVPIAEELAFRGYLLRRLTAVDFRRVAADQLTWISIVGSSVLFGLMHERLFAGTLAGLCYAFAFYRRGNLVDAIVAHAVTNAALATYVLATGRWWLWG